jgi:transposase
MRHWLQRACQLASASTSATCANLPKLWPALWTFITHAGVEPAKNDAERAIRPIVLKRMISRLTRSKRGDEFIARAYSVALSCRRQGLGLLAFTHHSVLGWINRT